MIIMNRRAIYVSINPKATKKIEAGIKNHEFRNYIPKKYLNCLYVYETAPTSKLKYVIDLGEIIKYPDKLELEGDGNEDFNIGNKTKYAYALKAIYKLLEPIELEMLKRDFNFLPPQAFAYDKKYPLLTETIEKAAKNNGILICKK